MADEPLRVATFNVETLGTPAGAAEASLAERVAVLRPQLARLRADVLCLQEVDATRLTAHGPRVAHALDEVLAGTAYAGFARVATHGVHGPQAGLRDKHNLLILSRFPILASAQYENTLVPTPRLASAIAPGTEHCVAWDRPILHAALALPSGQTLHVVNVHFKAPLASHIPGAKQAPFVWSSVAAWGEGFLLSALKRAGQAFETRLLVERLIEADADALIAVCGDFNAESGEMPVRLVAASEEDTGNGALAARALVPLDRSVPRSLRFTTVHHGRPQMVDHILVSRPLLGLVRAVEVHNETLGDELMGPLSVERSPLSYHAPLVAVFGR